MQQFAMFLYRIILYTRFNQTIYSIFLYNSFHILLRILSMFSVMIQKKGRIQRHQYPSTWISYSTISIYSNIIPTPSLCEDGPLSCTGSEVSATEWKITHNVPFEEIWMSTPIASTNVGNQSGAWNMGSSGYVLSYPANTGNLAWVTRLQRPALYILDN